ncbi:MAG: hypothetical protein AAF846_11955 [Chloroflexota bacterium]
MRVRLFTVLTAIFLSACQAIATPVPLPTRMQFPTATPIVVTPTVDPLAEPATVVPQVIIVVTATPSPTIELATRTESPPTATITSTQTPTLLPVQATATDNATPFLTIEDSLYADISFSDAFELVSNTPLVVIPTEHVRSIYQRGRTRGLRNDFLLSVGDCNSESGWYLETLLDDNPPESGVDASYYADTNIQSTIEHFSDAFAFKGQSVNSGLNAASVLDPFWASADICAFGDSPLTCDYKLTDSFASLIMFGANDVNVLSTASYERAMRNIIETTLERDVIPIISTFSVRPIEDDSAYAIGVRFNAVLIQLAEEYQIPLVNFFQATRTLADGGILEDNAHLTVSGFNIRNQLTVEVLTQIRTDIMQETRNS